MANMSFLPEDFVQKKEQRRTNVISLTLFVVVMTGVICAFLVTDRQRQEVRAMQVEVNEQYKQAAQQLDKLDQLQRQKQQMIRKASVTSTLLERVPRSLLLAELVNNMPASVSLLEVDLKTKELKRRRRRSSTALDAAKRRAKELSQDRSINEVKPVKVTIVLVGVAQTDVQVAKFLASLGQSEMFTNVNLVYSEEVSMNDDLLRKFRIEMLLNQGMNVQELEPKKVRRSLIQNPMGNTIQINPTGEMVMPADPPKLGGTTLGGATPGGATAPVSLQN